MHAAVRVVLTFFVVAAAATLGYDLVRYYIYSPWTRDARVRADSVTIAPDVSGYVTDVRARNDQFVHRGDLLFVVDKERYQLALADAEATLGVRDAQKQMLLSQKERREKLRSGFSVSAEELDNSRRQFESAAAQR